MQFAIVISSPAQSAAMRRALEFTRAVLASGHSINRVFFYQDAVLQASSLQVVAQDETNLAQQWQDLIKEHQLDAVVCIAAALRRGLVDAAEAQRYDLPASNLLPGFVLSGLGQLHEAIQEGERVVHFRGQA